MKVNWADRLRVFAVMDQSGTPVDIVDVVAIRPLHSLRKGSGDGVAAGVSQGLRPVMNEDVPDPDGDIATQS